MWKCPSITKTRLSYHDVIFTVSSQGALVCIHGIFCFCFVFVIMWMLAICLILERL